MAAHLNKCSYNSTHHVSQEAIGLDDEKPFGVTRLYPLCLHNIAEGGLDIGMTLAETRKILVFHQHTRCLIHKRKIEVVMAKPGIMTIEGSWF